MFHIVTTYRFTPLTELSEKRARLRAAMRQHSIKGTLILAEEGFNSTVCGAETNLRLFIEKAEEILGSQIEYKTSVHPETPFRRIDVKIKPEIVTLKQPVDIS